MKPKVSVIISTYNRKPLLKKAIKSVLNQSFQEWELIVVDDCSTVDVKKLVKSFGDDRIRYYKTKENTGHDSKPKNIGIDNARGEYICFLDDDDKYFTDSLKILYTYIAESGADVVYGDYRIDGKAGISSDFSSALLSKMNYIAMPVVIVRKEALLEVGGFDQDVPKFKDWNLWLRLQKRGYRFLHIPIFVADVSIQKGSISDKFEADTDEQGNYLPTFFNPADCTIYPDNTLLGKRKPLKVAIYTLAMDRLEYTKKMYKSIDELSGYEFDWFVLDQNSKDGTDEWIKSLTRDKGEHWRGKLVYKLYKKNTGIAKGWNNAIELIKKTGDYDIVIKVDNDAQLMTEGWLKDMVEIFERNRTLILSPSVEGLDGLPGGVLRQRQGDSPYVTINDRVLGIVPNLGGIVFATPIELFNEWTFNPSFDGNKDYLLSQYASAMGYSMFYMEEYRVAHIDGTKGQHEKFPEYFASDSNLSSTK